MTRNNTGETQMATFNEYDRFVNQLNREGEAALDGWHYTIHVEPVRVQRYGPDGEMTTIVGMRGQPFFNRSAAFGFIAWDARQKAVPEMCEFTIPGRVFTSAETHFEPAT